jgi:hypothetical protein
MRKNASGRGGNPIRATLVAVAVSGLWLAPGAFAGENRKGGDPHPSPPPTPFATLQLYEVQEGTDLKGPDDDPRLRLANASLVGTASGGLCTAGQDPCAFDTRALSHVPLAKGVGELQGDFQVLFDTMLNPGHLLSDLVLVATGSVKGTLDLRPLLGGTQPIALMAGRWQSRQIGARGTFKGTFLVPFPDPTKTCATGFAYLDPDAGLQCLTPAETSLGRPVTKVVATFLRTGSFGPGDPDDEDDGDHGRR